MTGLALVLIAAILSSTKAIFVKLAYPYGVSTEYGILGSGGRCAVGGPVFRRANFAASAKRVYPSYFEGKWIVTDCVRAWITVLTPNADHTRITNAEILLANEKSAQPLDLDFGPSGDLYVMEYDPRGPQGRLSKIEYNGGNRAPRRVGYRWRIERASHAH